MSVRVEILFVWVPILASIGLVSWFWHKICREGLTFFQALSDRRFLMVFLYTGSLLAIYLSTFHFFYSGLT